MFFILSKTITVLLMPIFWLLTLLLGWVFIRNKKWKRFCKRAFIFLFIILTNPFIINTLLLMWEVNPTPIRNLKNEHTVGIVLTGIVNYVKSPHDRIYLEQGSDRIMHALWLYRQGKIKKIFITGGVIDIMGRVRTSESSQLAKILEMSGVPKSDILLEENARNTRENALFSKEILSKKFPKQKYLLITSAFHLRRAQGCFEKVGLEVTPFSAGVLTHDFNETGWRSFVPSERALYLWYTFAHELLGYLTYRVLGYV
jgi:uncharacterized SAM-binding protein YcdF (DUF218 family)